MSEEDELSNLEMFLALTLVTVAFFGGVLLLGRFSQDDSSNSSFSSDCGTRFDHTACPEPNYEPSVEELRKIPDATEYDNDPCGGFDC